MMYVDSFGNDILASKYGYEPHPEIKPKEGPMKKEMPQNFSQANVAMLKEYARVVAENARLAPELVDYRKVVEEKESLERELEHYKGAFQAAEKFSDEMRKEKWEQIDKWQNKYYEVVKLKWWQGVIYTLFGVESYVILMHLIT